MTTTTTEINGTCDRCGWDVIGEFAGEGQTCDECLESIDRATESLAYPANDEACEEGPGMKVGHLIDWLTQYSPESPLVFIFEDSEQEVVWRYAHELDLTLSADEFYAPGDAGRVVPVIQINVGDEFAVTAVGS